MPPKVIQISCGPEDCSSRYLLEEGWRSVTKALEERAELTTIKSLDNSTMKEFNPSAVMVMEAGMDKLDSKLIDKTAELKALAEDGAIVCYGGHIAPIVNNTEFKSIFGEKGFNVGWSFGRYIGYHAGTADKTYKPSYGHTVKGSLNRNAEVFINNSRNLQSAQFPDEIDPFQPLVVTVKNPAHVLYSVVDSQVKTREEYNGVGVMAPVGKGFVCFWGDRDNNVAQTVKVITAMIGLPEKQQ
ncbi:hypothetical protein MY10362_003155 [Beauveria mimosiformis]